MATISERIQEALLLRGMKQTDLVKKTKIGKSSISTYISGEYEPKQKNIYKIAQALDVSEGWLMGFDVPMERDTKKYQSLDNERSTEELTADEAQLLTGYRSLSDQGKEYIRQTLSMAQQVYKKSDPIPDVENRIV